MLKLRTEVSAHYVQSKDLH